MKAFRRQGDWINRSEKPIRGADPRRPGRAEETRPFSSGAEDYLSALREVTGSVAHAINDALTVILGNAELLQRELSAPLQGVRLQRIQESVWRLQALSQDLLTFGDPARVERTGFDLNEAIARVARLLEARLVADGIQLTVDLDPQLPLFYGNPAQLQQVFLNLLRSAHEALGQNQVGAAVTIATQQISANQVRVTVANDTPAQLPSLALADWVFTLSQNVIRDHDGTFTMRHQDEGGHQFIIDLPVRLPTERPEWVRTAVPV